MAEREERWQQWMPFHINRFRGSQEVQAMSPAARMGYLYLLASAWQTNDCTVSADPMDLATESGLGDELWAIHGPRILRNFTRVESGRLQNGVLFREWEEARSKYEAGQKQRTDAAKKGAQARWSSRPGNENMPGRDEKHAENMPTYTGTGTDTTNTPHTPQGGRKFRVARRNATAPLDGLAPPRRDEFNPEAALNFYRQLREKSPDRWKLQAPQWARDALESDNAGSTQGRLAIVGGMKA